MSRVLIATGNRGKIAEFKALLGDGVDVASLQDVEIMGAEEIGETFEENAVLKATHAARESGLFTVADDSGIVVDALGGAPGVHSARFAGKDATDERNRKMLIAELEDAGDVDWNARFVCVIAVAQPDGTVCTFHGTLDGVVTSDPRGDSGFGYDPIFELADGRTVAELTAEEKNHISHRGTALRNALPYLQELLGGTADEPED